MVEMDERMKRYFKNMQNVQCLYKAKNKTQNKQ